MSPQNVPCYLLISKGMSKLSPLQLACAGKRGLNVLFYKNSPANWSWLPTQSGKLLFLDFDMCPLKLNLAERQDMQGLL